MWSLVPMANHEHIKVPWCVRSGAGRSLAEAVANCLGVVLCEFQVSREKHFHLEQPEGSAMLKLPIWEHWCQWPCPAFLTYVLLETRENQAAKHTSANVSKCAQHLMNFGKLLIAENVQVTIHIFRLQELLRCRIETWPYPDSLSAIHESLPDRFVGSGAESIIITHGMC